ncbi:hypothetical protein HY627_01100 [Candidatus Uhrbacteria bacterium]|nr:hypothetical protein [Candidatus Uhrbacteria bacterium]
MIGSAPAAHASSSMQVSPSSGPVNTKVVITLNDFPAVGYFFIRFDKAEFPEYQITKDTQNPYKISHIKIPSFVTAGGKQVPITPGSHSIDLYQRTTHVLSVPFLVAEEKNPPVMTLTPSSGPVGTRVSIKVTNAPSLKSPLLRLKDGSERVSYQEVKAHGDGTMSGTYTVPKEVVKEYDTTGKAIMIPVVSGEHFLGLFEQGQVDSDVSAPFTVTSATDPLPPKEVPKDAPACDPNIPSYNQPACKPDATPPAKDPSAAPSTSCDPNIPSYAQTGCSPSKSGDGAPPPTDTKTCDPNIPSYAQVGCVPKDTITETEKKTSTDTESLGRRGRRFVADPASIEKGAASADDAETPPDSIELHEEIQQLTKESDLLKKAITANKKALTFFSVNIKALQAKREAYDAELFAITKQIKAGNGDEALRLSDELQEFDAETIRKSISLIQKSYAILKKVKDPRIKKELSGVSQLIGDSINAGDYDDAQESLISFNAELAKNKKLYLKKPAKKVQKKVLDALQKIRQSIMGDVDA